MKKYGIYNLIVKKNESIKERFEKLIINCNKDIKNFYYDSIKECYMSNKDITDKYKNKNDDVVTIMYEVDNSTGYNVHTLLSKKDIFEDFPHCTKFKEN